MPSLAFTPASLRFSRTEIFPEPVRFGFTPASLQVRGATMTVGPSLSSSLTALNAVLDTLFSSEAIVDQQGRPTRRFQQIWENAIGGLKDALTGQGLSITELQNLYTALNAAQATATAAAQQAQAADSARALTESVTNPARVVTARSTGSIDIVAHQRVYGDGTSVSVNSGSISGFAPDDYVTVFYNDAARAGGAVAYQGTTDVIGQTGSTHIVGQATIPQPGTPDVTGTGPSPPGYTPPPSSGPSSV